MPFFYGTTSFSLAPPGSESDSKYFQVSSILVQRINGFILDSLLDMTEASPDTD